MSTTSGNTISSKDLTIVFQGPVFHKKGRNMTASAIKTARRYFPESTIVLSTQVSEDTSEIDCDVIVSVPLRIDGFENEGHTRVANINNMIATSKAGLEQVATKYAAKIRTDMQFKNGNFLRYLPYSTQNLRLSKTVGKGRILFSNLTAVNPNYLLKLPHHPCDNFQAGRTEDLLKLWTCPFVPVHEIQYFREHPAPATMSNRENLLRFRNEAWVWRNYIAPVMVQGFENSYDCRKEVIDESNELFARNAIFMSLHQLGVMCLKNSYPMTSRAKMMSHWDWADLCERERVPYRKIFDFESLRVRLFREVLRMTALEKKVLFR